MTATRRIVFVIDMLSTSSWEFLVTYVVRNAKVSCEKKEVTLEDAKRFRHSGAAFYIRCLIA